MRHLFIGLLTFFLAPPLFAEAIQCNARVGLNRIYTVDLDTESNALSIQSDNGYSYSGQANKSVSGRTGNTLYFLALSYENAIEVELEHEGQSRIALCLEPNTCALCVRTSN